MPDLGLKAYSYEWYFDWELTYVGVGMLVPQVCP